MGDRANVLIVDGDSKVYLYTHWSGEELPETVWTALNRGTDRWTDGSYLARIIFNQMTAGDEMGTTGYGISSVLTDNEHPIIVVNPREGFIGLANEGQEPMTYIQIPIKEFAEMKDVSWESWEADPEGDD